MKDKAKYKITTSGNYIKIYINDINHITIPHSKKIIMQNWIDGEGTDTWFCIQIVVEGITTLYEYDDFNKWKTIIGLFDLVIK